MIGSGPSGPVPTTGLLVSALEMCVVCRRPSPSTVVKGRFRGTRWDCPGPLRLDEYLAVLHGLNGSPLVDNVFRTSTGVDPDCLHSLGLSTAGRPNARGSKTVWMDAIFPSLTWYQEDMNTVGPVVFKS